MTEKLRDILFKEGTVGRDEVRSWLRKTLATTTASQASIERLFVTLFIAASASDRGESPFSRQFLAKAFEAVPAVAVKAFEDDPDLFREFFRGDQKRIRDWFSRRGATALERFVFARRDEIWSRLEWSGKRENPPGVVAQKPQLWKELDVVATVEKVLCSNGDFWRSDQFRDSMASGEILSVDPDFFVSVLLSSLRDSSSGRARTVLGVIGNFVRCSTISSLLDNLLHLVPDSLIPELVRGLSDSPSIEMRIIGSSAFTTADDVFFANALMTNAPAVRLLLPTGEDAQKTPPTIDRIPREVSESTRSQRTLFVALTSFQWFCFASRAARERDGPQMIHGLVFQALGGEEKLRRKEYSMVSDDEDDCGKRKHRHGKRRKLGEEGEEEERASRSIVWEVEIDGGIITFGMADAANAIQRMVVKKLAKSLRLLD